MLRSVALRSRCTLLRCPLKGHRKSVLRSTGPRTLGPWTCATSHCTLQLRCSVQCSLAQKMLRIFCAVSCAASLHSERSQLHCPFRGQCNCSLSAGNAARSAAFPAQRSNASLRCSPRPFGPWIAAQFPTGPKGLGN